MPSDKFLNSIFKQKSLMVPSLENGKRNEGKAKSKYMELHPSRHFHECGLAVNNDFAYLGASPDGILCCEESGGIAEIKCPYSVRNCTIEEACTRGVLPRKKPSFWVNLAKIES